jgi:hypothetical protein
MDKQSALSFEKLHDILSYDPSTGIFLWRRNMARSVRVGARAGCDKGDGYRRICINRKYYREHRLAWFYVQCEWPKDEIDHIDGDRSNNRIDNLRTATHAQNHQNKGLQRDNNSGKHGVSWNKRQAKWEAYIKVNGKQIHLGTFDDLEAAGDAYLAAKVKLHEFNPVPWDV